MNRSDMFEIVSHAQEQLKVQGKNEWNLSLLHKMTGISRDTLRDCRDNGFPHVHRAKGKRKGNRVLARYEGKVNEMLSRGIVNSEIIYPEIKKLGYAGSRTTLKVYIKQHRNLVPLMLREIKTAQGNRGRRYKLEVGDCFQMDWGFVKAIDSFGRESKFACFAMVCGHCGKRYIEFFTNARQENLFIGMLHGFRYLGGIPRRVMTDNMKSVVISKSGPNIKWNTRYLDFMTLLGFSTTLNKVRHAFTKGRVERLVRYMKENFVVGRSYTDIGDLNDQALQWCREKNAETHRGFNWVPSIVHKTEDFTQLPPEKVLFPYCAPERSLSFDGFVEYEGYRYGVPYSYTRKKARVMREGRQVVILSEGGEMLVSYSIDWKNQEYCNEWQWDSETEQPQEQPTQPIHNLPLRQSPARRSETFNNTNLSIYDLIGSIDGGTKL